MIKRSGRPIPDCREQHSPGARANSLYLFGKMLGTLEVNTTGTAHIRPNWYERDGLSLMTTLYSRRQACRVKSRQSMYCSESRATFLDENAILAGHSFGRGRTLLIRLPNGPLLPTFLDQRKSVYKVNYADWIAPAPDHLPLRRHPGRSLKYCREWMSSCSARHDLTPKSGFLNSPVPHLCNFMDLCAELKHTPGNAKLESPSHTSGDLAGFLNQRETSVWLGPLSLHTEGFTTYASCVFSLSFGALEC